MEEHYKKVLISKDEKTGIEVFNYIENYIEIYTPDDRLLTKTNSENTFTDILIQIKKKNLSGCYFIYSDDVCNRVRHKIMENGCVDDEYPFEAQNTLTEIWFFGEEVV